MTALTASQQLRTRTAVDHEAVDAAFGRFDLTDPADYRRVLLAHATALLPAEAALGNGRHPETALPAWRPRTPLILADLADLGVGAQPEPLPFVPPGEAAGLAGVLYVLEGSRLGNAYLARTVPSSLPSRYMGARHLSGEWRAILAKLDREGERGGQRWIDDAVAGAHTAFDLYRRAAG